jgi:hypothetical protein
MPHPQNISCVSGFPLTAGTLHLFNIAADPDERTDVLDQHPDIASGFITALLAAEGGGTHTAVFDASCGPVVKPVDPHVGPVWAPWC